MEKIKNFFDRVLSSLLVRLATLFTSISVIDLTLSYLP